MEIQSEWILAAITAVLSYSGWLHNKVLNHAKEMGEVEKNIREKMMESNNSLKADLAETRLHLSQNYHSKQEIREVLTDVLSPVKETLEDIKRALDNDRYRPRS